MPLRGPLSYSSFAYRQSDCYVLGTIIELETLSFCRAFLDFKNDPKGRQYDQMTQAARSGVKNLRDGDRIVPALVFHLANGLDLTARRIAISAVRDMARLNLRITGRDSNSEEAVQAELMKLGYNSERSTSLRESPFNSVLNAADVLLSPRIIHRFRAVMWDEFSGPVKGDARYHQSLKK